MKSIRILCKLLKKVKQTLGVSRCILQNDTYPIFFFDGLRISIDFILLFLDDDNYDLSLRKSDSEGEEDTSEQDEKRRLERLEREKWIKG